MKSSERALLQERVRTLVLTHAIEATLNRLIALGGPDAGQELLALEHRIVAAGRTLGVMPGEMALSTMVAVEDAIASLRGAFDRAHERLEARLEAAAPAAQPIAPLAA